MIPTTLGESDVDTHLPISVKETIHRLDEFIVENAKTARSYLKKMGIPTPQSELKLHVLNKHTKVDKLQTFLDGCRKGRDIGLLSEAGCPGVADPGAEIARIAHHENIQVRPLIGPSSILLALMGSGMNGQSFTFHGYLPKDKSELKNKIKEIEKKAKSDHQTQLFIETPFRNIKLLESLLLILHPDTNLCIACDLSLAEEFIKTKTIAEWRSSGKQNIHKRPCIFLVYVHV
tara:strand:+ start:13476 stop:14171 length:696 start_codon:yes stop_codon:yes gene_type:complete